MATATKITSAKSKQKLTPLHNKKGILVRALLGQRESLRLTYQSFQDGDCQYSRGRCWYIDSKMATVELHVAIEKTIFKQMYSVPHCFREDSIQTFVLVSLLSLPRLNQDVSSILKTTSGSQGTAKTQINPRSEAGC